MKLPLLIEPVWNRNLALTGDNGKFYGFLLIEPVWNRNVHYKYYTCPNCDLLIEPVWNRNAKIYGTDEHCFGLLIEPVWNRNAESVLEKHLINANF